MRRRFAMLLVSAAVLSACSDDDKQSPVLDGGNQLDGAAPVTGNDAATANDAGSAPASDAATPSDCFQNPSTYLQILNACTDAEKVVKKPSLPLLMVDGGLPPLP